MDDLTTPAPARRGWRVVDIVVAAVLGVACGLIFWAWNGIGYAWYDAMNALTPGLGGVANGLWLLGGPLGGLIIRRPGAALFVELVAAIVSTMFGNQWGISTLWFGLAQGLGAEIALLVFAYRRFELPFAVFAGALAGVTSWASELVTGNMAKGAGFNTVYLVCDVVSGAVLAGVVAWALARGLARTGVLGRFASGRT